MFPLSNVTRNINVHRLVNNFRDADQTGNIWYELIHVTSI